MADPLSAIGAAASILQLIDASVQISKTFRELFKDFKEEPQQVKAVQIDIDLVRLRLQSLRNTLEDVDSAAHLPQDLNDLFQASISCVRKAFQSIEEALDSLKNAWGGKTDTSVRSKIKWAIQDKKTVESLRDQLRHAETGLSDVTGILTLRLSMNNRTTLERIASNNTASSQKLLDNLNSVQGSLSGQIISSQTDIVQQISSNTTSSSQALSNQLTSIETTLSNQLLSSQTVAVEQIASKNAASSQKVEEKLASVEDALSTQLVLNQTSILEQITSSTTTSSQIWSQQFSTINHILTSQKISNERLVSTLDLLIANLRPTKPLNQSRTIPQTAECITAQNDNTGIFEPDELLKTRRHRRYSAIRARQRNAVTHHDYQTILRLLEYTGVRASFWLASSTESTRTTTSIRISAQLPGWLWSNKHIAFRMAYEKLNNSWSDIAIQSSRFRVRNMIQEDSTLYQAMANGELEVVRFLVERREFGINDVDTEERSLLNIAIDQLGTHFSEREYPAIAPVGSNTSIKSSFNRCSCRYGQLVDQENCPYWKIVLYLIENGIDINTEDYYRETSVTELINTARYFPNDGVAFYELGFKLLRLGALIDGESDHRRFSYVGGLTWAKNLPGLISFAQSATVTGELSAIVPKVHSMNPRNIGFDASGELVRKAVKEGKDVLAADEHKFLPIHYAIIEKNLSCFKELLNVGLKSDSSSYYRHQLLPWILDGNCCADCCRGHSCGNIVNDQWSLLLQASAGYSDAKLVADQCKHREGCGGVSGRIHCKKGSMGYCFKYRYQTRKARSAQKFCTRKLIEALTSGYKTRKLAVPEPFQELFLQTEMLYNLPDYVSRDYIGSALPGARNRFGWSKSSGTGFASQVDLETPSEIDLTSDLTSNQSQNAFSEVESRSNQGENTPSASSEIQSKSDQDQNIPSASLEVDLTSNQTLSIPGAFPEDEIF